jgi:hypothetical protein
MVLAKHKNVKKTHQAKKVKDIYYGNGVHVINGKAVVNWNQAWGEIVNRAFGAYADGIGEILGGIGSRGRAAHV